MEIRWSRGQRNQQRCIIKILCLHSSSMSPKLAITLATHLIGCYHPMTSSLIALPALTFVSSDWGDVPGRRRQAEDVSTLDLSLCLHIVLKGAVDPRWQIGHIASLEDQLRVGGGEGESKSERISTQCLINGRTRCTWIVIRYDMRVNGCWDRRGVIHGYVYVWQLQE